MKRQLLRAFALVTVLSVVCIGGIAQETGPYQEVPKFIDKAMPDSHNRMLEHHPGTELPPHIQEPSHWGLDRFHPHHHNSKGTHQSLRQPRLYEEAMNEGARPKTPSRVSEAWARYYGSGLLPAEDQPYGIAVDNSGNVYVTGTSTSAVGTDCVTLKYNSAGTILWSAQFDGGKDDGASVMTLDALGNIYVAGWSVGAGTSSDFITIKYNTAGNEQWIARYNGPGNFKDGATAIAVDASGNVHVTGYSQGSGTQHDYATIKYSPTGNELWVARFNGDGNPTDFPTAIAVDPFGNVYVTGASGNPLADWDYDFVTIKYNSTGVEEWIARYDGPANHADYAWGLALDAAGNVYVTGTSLDTSSYNDYLTIKYSPAGSELWVARYDGPVGGSDEGRAIVVDNEGNILVTGNSDGEPGSVEFATIKYSPSGSELWVVRQPGVAWDMAVDDSGSIYVTGHSYDAMARNDLTTTKYDPAGNQLWVSRYNGPSDGTDVYPAITLDATGNVYIVGESTGELTATDYATIKYNSDGVEQWAARYDGRGISSDRAKAIAVDGFGNVYATGYSRNPDTSSWNNYAYVTVKYDEEGSLQWSARYNGPADDWDSPSGIAVDAEGNVYVTGESYGVRNSITSLDYATVKYNSSGVQEWVARYNGPGDVQDGATAITVDHLGYVYVTGSSMGSGTSSDFATIKYNTDGVVIWVARYNGPANSVDRAIAIAVDSSSNVYVTGVSVGQGTSHDYATIKYDAAGIEQWVARYDGPANGWDEPAAIAVDASGNVYVTGSSRRLAFLDYDYATIKYNPEGNEEWVARYNGPQNNGDYAGGMVIDASGNAYVTGTSFRGFAADFTTVKYSPAGNEEWVDRFNYRGHGEDRGKSIAMDGSGNVFVVGWSNGWNSYWDYGIVKYSPEGNREWVRLFDGPGNDGDYAVAVAADQADNLFITGYSLVRGGTTITTVKYDWTTLSVDENRILPSSFALFQNYPNPFNPGTTLSFDIHHSTFVILKVYNLLGQEVRTLVNERKEPGMHRVEFNAEGLPSGVYIYRIQAGGYSASRKMVLTK